eukprot:1202580-Amphidinium_carterae.1
MSLSLKEALGDGGPPLCNAFTRFVLFCVKLTCTRLRSWSQAQGKKVERCMRRIRVAYEGVSGTATATAVG